MTSRAVTLPSASTWRGSGPLNTFVDGGAWRTLPHLGSVGRNAAAAVLTGLWAFWFAPMAIPTLFERVPVLGSNPGYWLILVISSALLLAGWIRLLRPLPPIDWPPESSPSIRSDSETRSGSIRDDAAIAGSRTGKAEE